MLRIIMVPLDGSAFAEQALPLALATARRARARLHLVLVRPSLPLDNSGTTADAYLTKIALQLEAVLPRRITRRVLTNEFGPLEYPLAFDTVAEVLARHAEEHDVDLIMMTTHGRGGVRRAWLGSAADSLMRIASRPVLLIRPDDDSFSIVADSGRGINHILIPLDGSDTAERVIPFAEQLGQVFDARYTLVRVVSPLVFNLSAEWNGAFLTAPVNSSDHDAAAEYLDEIADEMRALNLRVTTVVREAASPESAIIDYARVHAADLVALSTRGAGGMRRLLLGSVADKIVRSGEVPVLVCNVRHLDVAAEPLVAATAELGAAF